MSIDSLPLPWTMLLVVYAYFLTFCEDSISIREARVRKEK